MNMGINLPLGWNNATVDTRARLDAHMKNTQTSIPTPASRLEIKLMHSAHSDWWAIDRCPFSPRGAEPNQARSQMPWITPSPGVCIALYSADQPETASFIKPTLPRFQVADPSSTLDP
ncbi:hypothetical protein PGT21_027574 [Puccinia graminis f. sp. tritici]|uniref:Uncharacterized protein n=1 Tax=Puccinia graminis f. sp. tritici TaxID=56615 RepID=A0A5B0PUZ4_PUCGR|nr:hypothetical protein PGTUg99_001945 [Puccinia graminis f. sp. tritici]KAA1104592.1 hypothetical protein PGT21_027574 [Puccinia graminis f. sp. tritici]